MLQFTRVGFAYGRRQVFSGFDLEVGSGRKVLLGPNGAGKSTLMGLACGYLRPQAGAVSVNDRWVSGRSTAQWIGHMPQQVPVVRGFTVAEQATYFGWLKGLAAPVARKEAHLALERVDLTQLLGQKAGRLSGGQLRRLGLACALVGSPKVLLLDEPTAGLDPAQRARVRGLIQGLSDDMSVIVSTHQVDDVADIYDEVIVISRGDLVWQGSPIGFVETVPDSGSKRVEDAYLALLGEDDS